MREKSHVNCNGGTSGGKSPLLTPLCYYRGAVACGVADVDGGVVFLSIGLLHVGQVRLLISPLQRCIHAPRAHANFYNILILARKKQR